MLPGSIFLDFNLPNGTTWFYFSVLLAVALFFKFSRLVSIRNLDILTIFILMPGLLLIQQAHQAQLQATGVLVAGGTELSSASGTAGLAGLASTFLTVGLALPSAWYGYLWLLGGSAFLLFRCLLDLALVRRPALSPNLNFGGLAWLAVALFICLSAVAFRPPASLHEPTPDGQVRLVIENDGMVGRPPAAVQLAQTPLEPSFFLLRGLAMLCHLSVVVGLILIGRRHFQDASAGMAAATFYLMLPYTGHFVGQVHHVWPMALMIWALVFYRQPLMAGLFLGLAAGTVFFPALLLPIWVSFYLGRGVGRFLLSFLLAAGICLAITGLLLWLSDDLGAIIRETMAQADWQPWKIPTQEGFWTGFHWAYRLPIFILFLALVVTTAIWPRPKNLAHVIALSAAVLIGVQFWYADRGGVYVLWYLPLLLLLIFRPNLSERLPPPMPPSGWNWLGWLGRTFGGVMSRLLRIPEPIARTR